jgi:hypothetical protein
MLQSREDVRFTVKADSFDVRELVSLCENLNRNMSACGDLNGFEDDSLAASAYFSKDGVAVNLYGWLVNVGFVVGSGQPLSGFLFLILGSITFLKLPDTLPDLVGELWVVSAEVLELGFLAYIPQAHPLAE